MSELNNIKVNLDSPTFDAGGGGYYFLNRPHQAYIHIPDVFSASEVRSIIAMGEDSPTELGKTSDYAGEDTRKCTVAFLYPNEITGWVFEKLTRVIHDANKLWGFELHGLFQGLQFTKYVAPDAHFIWHADMGGTVPSRKLSITVQLSEPSEYEGGELQLFLGDEPNIMGKDLGSVNIFPSWTIHRVTPVTQGIRYSLVAWVSGPPFK